MAKKILLPKLGLTMKKGKISKWRKKEGDIIKKGEIFLEIVTEKTNVKVESQYSGTLYKIVASEGNRVPVNTPIAVLAEDNDSKELLQKIVAETQNEYEEALSSLGRKKQKQKSERKDSKENIICKKITISPRAKKLVEKEGVDINQLIGTGPQGRITEKDVKNYIQELAKEDETNIIPIEGMREIIADRMLKSSRNTAKVTIMQDVDVTLLKYVRKKLIENEGHKFSYTDLIVKIVAKALREHKIMNSRVQDDKVEIFNSVNLGIAVDIEGGLVVPVIHKVHRMTLKQISNKIRDLAERARSGDLESDELEGGTFTITNLGMFGVEGFTPIINPPETAILGIGKIIDKPAVSGRNILQKSFMTLSLSFDHRVVDGGPAARFLHYLKDLIENPFSVFGLEKNTSITIPVIAGAKSPQQIYDKYKEGMDKLLEKEPDLAIGFGALTESVFFDGEISEIQKELIAVALSVYIKCEYCIAAHVYKALEAGATPEQIMEACGVAVFFGGGAALAYTSSFVQDCIDSFIEG